MIRWRDLVFLFIVDILRFLFMVALFTFYYCATERMVSPSDITVTLSSLDDIETLTVVAGKLSQASLLYPDPAYLDHWPSRAGE